MVTRNTRIPQFIRDTSDRELAIVLLKLSPIPAEVGSPPQRRERWVYHHRERAAEMAYPPFMPDDTRRRWNASGKE